MLGLGKPATPGADIHQQAALWWVRLRSPTVDAVDESGFSLWLNQDEAHAAAFAKLCQCMELAGQLENEEKFLAERRSMLLPRPAGEKRVTRRLLPGWRMGLALLAAASVAVIAGLGVLVGTGPSSDGIQETSQSRAIRSSGQITATSVSASYETAGGQTIGFDADDGSRIELNHGTRIEAITVPAIGGV
jgi:ferric-dicitrate binding protein FerR (iron transport regulator)